MAYFLGRDVHLAITTEHAVCGISVNDVGNVYPTNVKMAEVNSIGDGTEVFSTVAATGLSTGDPFTFSMDAGQTISSGVTAGTVYYAILSGTHGVKAAETYADAVAGTAIDITGASAGETNITRELTGGLTPNTFLFNREWPRYDGTGRIDTIIDDAANTARGIVETSGATKNSLTDLTGIDISIGKTDEDVAYFGQKTALKAEIKTDATVSITKKKSDHRWTTLWNKARCGLLSYTSSSKTAYDVDSATAIGSTLPAANTLSVNTASAPIQPQNGNFGYRIHIISKSGQEVITFRNMCISSYSTTLNADGITEETIEFYGYVDPIVDGNATYGYTTLTATSDL
jgi:hypothetical protein